MLRKHDLFTKVVERDLRNQGSASERAFLESSLDQWDDSLSMLYTEAIDNLGILKLRMAEEKQKYLSQGAGAKKAWFERKLELDRKRSATRHFSEYVRHKRFEVKQLKQKREAETRAAISPDAIADTGLNFPSSANELLSLLTHSERPKVDADLFLAAFAVRIVQQYDRFSPCEEEILDLITAVEPAGIMDMWDPDELS